MPWLVGLLLAAFLTGVGSYTGLNELLGRTTISAERLEELRSAAEATGPLRAEIQRLQQAAGARGASVAELQQAITTREARIDSLTEAVRACQSPDLARRLAATVTENSELRSELNKAEASLERLAETRDTLVNQNIEITKERDEFSKICLSEEANDHIIRRVRDLEKEKGRIDDRVAGLFDDIRRLEEDAQYDKKACEICQQRRCGLDALVDACGVAAEKLAEADELREERNWMIEESDRLAEEISSLEAQLQAVLPIEGGDADEGGEQPASKGRRW